MDIEITILGSGTSTGVPMLACDCATCTSDDPRDRRYRASLLVRWADHAVVIDTTPEFRLQMLRAGVCQLDAVLLTHTHADHVHGLDDLRPYSYRHGRAIPVYGAPDTLAWVRRHFSYIWEATQAGGGLPKIELLPVTGPFTAAGLPVLPIPVRHGALEVYGYRIGDMAYLSDVSEIPEPAWPLLRGLRLFIVDAVRYRPHATHFHLDAAVAVARRVGAALTVFTHLNHDFLHRRLEAELPAGMVPAYDGLVLPASVSG